MNILVVEDTEIVARAISRVLRTQGHTVTVAPDVPDGEYALARSAFDVLLLDREVLGQDGWALKDKAPPCTRVVLMTANPPPDAPPHYLKGEPISALLALVEGR